MDVPQDRHYPLSIPKGEYKPPVQRYALKLPDDIQDLHTVYIGVQTHTYKNNDIDSKSALSAIHATIEEWIRLGRPKPIYESFQVISGYDVPNAQVWVIYYTSNSSYLNHTQEFDLLKVHESLGSARESIGVWREQHRTPRAQLETNYSGNDYAPGLAQIKGSAQLPHKYSAYWGAARDRIPASAHDAFEQPSVEIMHGPSGAQTTNPVDSLGKYLKGENTFDNMVHIRTGQFWQRCEPEEQEAYETELEPTLIAGLAFLHENAVESGNLGLRYLRNLHSTIDEIQDPAEPRRETCAAGFFRNLADLERWTKRHKSHLAIYNGAHRHAKRFTNGVMRTWHEVSVLKRGQARFEYLNCTPDTGAIQFIALETH